MSKTFYILLLLLFFYFILFLLFLLFLLFFIFLFFLFFYFFILFLFLFFIFFFSRPQLSFPSVKLDFIPSPRSQLSFLSVKSPNHYLRTPFLLFKYQRVHHHSGRSFFLSSCAPSSFPAALLLFLHREPVGVHSLWDTPRNLMRFLLLSPYHHLSFF